MSQERARPSKRQQEEDEQAPAPDQTARRKSAQEASAITDEVLDDIDQALKVACGFDEDESVSDEQFDVRADMTVRSFQQKGGQ